MSTDNSKDWNQVGDNKPLDAYTTGSWKAPYGYHDLLHLALLVLISFNFYYLVFIYRMTDYTNEDETRPKKNPIAQIFLYLLIPFYSNYWCWLMAKKLNHLGESVGIYKDHSTLVMILPFFGLGLICGLILQNQFNQILCVRGGSSINATGVGSCKNCKATFPNDAKQCPICGAEYKENPLRKIALYLIATLMSIFAILIVFGSYYNIYSTFINGEPLRPIFAEENTSTTSSSNVALATRSNTESNVVSDKKSSTSSNDSNKVSRSPAKLKSGPDGKWGMFYDNGYLNSSYNGLAQNEDDGNWYVIEDGYVLWSFSGLIRNDDMKQWFYAEKGKVRFDYSGDYRLESGDSVTLKNGRVMEATFVTEGNEKVTITNGEETIT